MGFELFKPRGFSNRLGAQSIRAGCRESKKDNCGEAPQDRSARDHTSKFTQWQTISCEKINREEASIGAGTTWYLEALEEGPGGNLPA